MDTDLSGEDRLGQARLSELPHQNLDLGQSPPPPSQITGSGPPSMRLPELLGGVASSYRYFRAVFRSTPALRALSFMLWVWAYSSRSRRHCFSVIILLRTSRHAGKLTVPCY